MEESSVAQKLKQLRTAAKISQAQAAKAVGLSLGGYQRYEDDDRFHRRYLPLDIAEPLAKLIEAKGGDSAPWYELAGIALSKERQPLGLSDVGLVRYSPPPTPDRRQRVIAAMTDGESGWVPYIVRDRSLDRRGYMPGDIVIIDHQQKQASPRDVVCVQLRDWDTMSARTVLRLYRAPYVVAASSDESCEAVDQVDNSRVSIEGVAVASFRIK